MSLRTRVTLSTVAILGAGLAIISITLNLLLVGRLSADASTLLANRADAQVSTLLVRNGTVKVRENPDDASLDAHAWIFDADGNALERSPASGKLAAAVQRLKSVDEPTEVNPTEHMRLLARPIDGAGVVVVGVSMDPYRHTERLAIVFTVILDIFVLVAGALAARRAVGTALRPVAEMTERAAHWSENDLHRRFGLGPPRDELTALAATLDGLLDRVAASLRHERRFSAELSHELRTPLARVIAESELALRRDREPEEYREALEVVRRSADQLSRTVDALVAAARFEAGGDVGLANAEEVAASAAAACAGLAASREVAVEVVPHAGLLRIGVDPDLAERILQPVVENACRYGSSRVQVNVARENSSVLFAIDDDGPGVADDERERIFEPGVRGQNANGSAGAGLGLALSRRLARTVHGDVYAETSAAGGRFLIRLPAA